jgi:sec-independent protein translocase protein TatB
MFGMGLGELVVVALVALVVIGPKDLPVYLRRAGQFARKLRVMASEMREQSGIDEVLRETNLHQELAELRKLAKGELEAVQRGASLNDPVPAPALTRFGDSQSIVFPNEFPVHGADAAHATPAALEAYGEPEEVKP